MSFQNNLQNYIERQNIVLQSEASLKESEDKAEQEKIQMEMARDEAGGQIAMGSILPIEMVSKISSMKNFAKKLNDIKDIVGDNDALKNVKGWAKKKLGMKDTDGDDEFEPDKISMQPLTSEDMEEPELVTERLSQAPVATKTKSLFGDGEDWFSGADQSLARASERIEEAPTFVDWEHIASNIDDYEEPIRDTYSPLTLAQMRRESEHLDVIAKQSSLEKGLGGREPEQDFKYKGITQGEHEYQRGIKSELSDQFAEREGLEPIAEEESSGVVLPDLDELAGGYVPQSYAERFGGGIEAGMARVGQQRGSSMLADVMRAERLPKTLATTGEEIAPEITPIFKAEQYQFERPQTISRGLEQAPPSPTSEIRPVRQIPQFEEGGETTQIPDFPESLRVPETLEERPSIDIVKPTTARLREGLDMTADDDLDEEDVATTGSSWLKSLLPESFGEGVGTGLAVLGFGAELYTGIMTIKDAFKETHLIDREQADINRESQAIYNRPTFDFGQQAISNRDSGLGESSFNHF